MNDQENQGVKEALSDKKTPCQVTYYLGDECLKGTSTHFSERGILIFCKNPAPLNSKLKLELQFPGFKNILKMGGEVVWTNMFGPGDSLTPKGMGVKFSALDRDTERVLSELAAQYDALGSIYTCYYT